MRFNVTDGLFWGASGYWVLTAFLLTAIVHLAFALAVYGDAQLLDLHLRRKTFLVGGVIWALATLMGGVFVAGVYWLVHHSTLCPPRHPIAVQPRVPSPAPSATEAVAAERS